MREVIMTKDISWLRRSSSVRPKFWVNAQGKSRRDSWEKWETGSKIFAAILLPLILAVGTVYLNQSFEAQKQREARRIEEQKQQEIQRMEEQKAQETRIQLYTTLMNQREGADTGLRKDLFGHLMTKVVGQRDDAVKLRDQVLNLELLANNFHDSIDLRALFYAVQRDLIDKSESKDRQAELRARLKRIAAEIRNRQFSALVELANSAHFTIDLSKVTKDYSEPPLVCEIHDKKTGTKDEYVVLSGVEKDKLRKFHIRTLVLAKNETTEEINVRIQIITETDTGKYNLQAAEMWVGSFDFPAIDSLRIQGSDHRCAVVLNHFEKSMDEKEEPNFAKISILVFPGCRASLKEKAYYENVADQLLPRRASEYGSK
jgi:hypothetical protein